ncbi:MAG: type VI secretion system protein TssA [Desulfovibrio sp.]|jgi:type VI secretion system protein VasJ|nr:type VI secretion system protein TssA [Desulfovibrio sp.]
MNLDDIGRTPIPTPLPAGQDAHYEPAFAQLQAEIDKLSSVTAGGAVDWTRVVDLAGEVLSTLAKDLTAAAYLGAGLTQTRGLDGLALGARILNDLATTFWDACTPPKNRLRGRMAAFAWWQEKTMAWLRGATDLPPLAAEAHRALTADVRALDETLGGLLPDFPPMRDLLELLNRLDVLPDPSAAPAPEASADVPAGQAQRPAAAQAAVPAQSAPQDARQARMQLAEAALNLAALAGREDPADPWAWRASRIGAWARLEGLPPAEGGRTLLPPPEQAVKNALLNLLTQGNPLLAAQMAEEQVSAWLFWLDPHRVAAKALEALGPDYARAHAALCAEVRLFLRLLPGVADLAFSDGTPFADPDTKAWLASLASSEEGADGHVGAAATDAAGMVEAAKARAEAEQHFARQDVAGALDILGQAARRATDGPARLRLKLAQMSLLGRAGHWPVAMSLAEEVVAEVERRGLEDWDPDLAVEALLAAREVGMGLGGETGLSKAGNFASWAARIRPSAALHLAG